MVQSISGSITNLHAVCRDTVFANSLGTDGLPVLVSLGAPGKYQPNAIVAVGMGIRMPIERPTLGTNRSREQPAEIEVTISCWVPGDEDAQPLATANALDLLSLLETHFRTSPNETLGGACRESWVSVGSLVQQATYQPTDDPAAPPVPTGRVAEIVATITASIRY
jgi:hypothetical protein